MAFQSLKYLPTWLIGWALLGHILISYSHAQTHEPRQCATPLLNHYHQQKYQSLKNKWLPNGSTAVKTTLPSNPLPQIIKIPVVVHVLHNVADGQITGTNISKEQIESQIKVLNEDFRRMQGTNGFNNHPAGADTQFEFHLATTDPNCNPTDGITRHFVNRNSFNVFSDETLIKSYGFWPSHQYLNIWVCSISGGFLGATQFPNDTQLEGLNDFNGDSLTDGIIIRHNVFGRRTGTASTGIYSYGRTLTHEIGHWLGLIHIWGDERCGNDYCDDTPQAEDSNLQSNCNAVFSNCTGTPTRNMIENYMDYTPDICMNIFTNDQKKRMREAMENSPRRNALINSPGLLFNNQVSLPYFVNNADLAPQNPSVLTEASCARQLLSITPTSNKATIYSQPLLIPIDNTNTVNLQFNWLKNSPQGMLNIYYLPGACSQQKVLIKSISSNTLNSTLYTHPDCPSIQNIVANIAVSNQNFVRLIIEWEGNNNEPIFFGNLKIYPTGSSSRVSILENPLLLRTQTQFQPTDKKIKVDVGFGGQATDIRFELYNTSGHQVLNKYYSNVLPDTYYLNGASLTAGLYILKTYINGHTSHSRIVVY